MKMSIYLWHPLYGGGPGLIILIGQKRHPVPYRPDALDYNVEVDLNPCYVLGHRPSFAIFNFKADLLSV